MADEQRIWAPWRIGYVVGENKADETQILPNAWQPGADHGCFLCQAAGEYSDPKTADRQNLTITRDRHTITVLNRFPYNNGHLLIAPLRHVGGLADLGDDEQIATINAIRHFTRVLEETMSPEGFNIGLNLGRVAGAGLPGHLHWHIVPRWSGDANFMSSVAGIRVIPQSLEALWEALTEGKATNAP